jgi:O-antigen ligase
MPFLRSRSSSGYGSYGNYGSYGSYGGYGYGYGREGRRKGRGKSFFVIGVFLSLLVSFYSLVMLDYVDFSYRNLAILIGITFSYALILTDLRIGLVLMYFSFGFSPEFSVAGVPNIRLEDFLIPIVLLAWLTKVANRRMKFQPLNIKSPIIALVFLMLFSSMVNISFFGLNIRRSALYLMKELEYFLVLYLVLNNLSSRRELKAFIILALIISFGSGMYHYLLHKGGSGLGRVSGPMGETANVIGAYYVIHMLLALGLLFSLQQWKYRILLAGYLILMTLPFMNTYSRTSFISFFGAMIIVGVLRSRRMLVAAIILFVFVTTTFNEAIIVRFGTIARIFSATPPPAWTARVEGWGEYWEFIEMAPFFGHGVGRMGLLVDNEYIKVASEIGFSGLIVFLWLIFMIGLTAYRTCGITKSKFFSGFAVGYFAAFIALTIHCIGTTSFTTIRSMMPFYFLTGILYVIYNKHTIPERKIEVELGEIRYASLTDDERNNLLDKEEEIREEFEPTIPTPIDE